MNVDDEIGGINYLEAGIDQLIALIDEIVARHSAWTIVQQTRAGIAAWEVGINQILRLIPSLFLFYISNNSNF